MNTSEVAQFRKRQAAQETAARLGLTAPAIVSRHDFIEARAERSAAQILQLLAQGKYEEAQRRMNLPDWELEGEERSEMSHFDTMHSPERRG